MLTRRQLLAAAPGVARAAAARTNFILILADDMGYGDPGCYGSTVNRTPHLDRLAADGVRFTDHYSCSPVCSPARAGLLTGLAPERTGVTGVLREEDDGGGLSLDLSTLADDFRKQGLRTALIGKWHLGMSPPYQPNRRGFDYFWGFLNGTINYETHISTGGGGKGQRTTYENGKPVELSGYYPELTAARAVRFIEENRSTPYFLYLSLALPHLPLQAPDRWTAPFRHLDERRATYAGMMSCLDDTVGQVRAALERTGQAGRTAIVFLSDNGWVKKGNRDNAEVGSNGALRGGKYELLEGGIRVPAIVRWPGVTRAGSVCRVPSWFCDWVPTLAGRATRDGVDLRDVLRGQGPQGERALRWNFTDALVKTPPSQAVRRGRWKYLRVGEEKSLFDLEADPGENANRIAENPRLAAELEKIAPLP